MNVLICSRTKSILNLLSYWRFLFLTLSKTCTTCLFISKSFKELFFNGFLSESGCKGKAYFWTTKTFRKKFSKKSFFQRRFVTFIFVQYFNSSAFLSRKRVQKYCFTTYTPNPWSTFSHTFLQFHRKSLILKTCRKADSWSPYGEELQAIHWYLYARVYTGDTIHNPSPYSPPFQTHNKVHQLF